MIDLWVKVVYSVSKVVKSGELLNCQKLVAQNMLLKTKFAKQKAN